MIAKELRALAPVWGVAAIAVIACGLVRDLYPFGIPAYFVGAGTLGAMSMGHEYSHRTLSTLLTLPVSRRRILLTKLVVLAAFLSLLAIMAALVLPFWREALTFRATVLWLPFFTALFMTPYLTTITRSPVGGAVFTMGIAGMLLIVGDWLGVARYGYTREVDAFRVAFVWRAEIMLCAASAVLMYGTFTRLQTQEGSGPALDLSPRRASTSLSLTRRSVTRLLVEKELGLQQLAFAVAALYFGLYLVTVVRTRSQSFHSEAIFIVSMLYGGVVAVIIGAVASAEERHLNTLDAQLLLPARTSQQWAIKLAVVLGLTFVLGILWPALLASIFPPERLDWTRAILSSRSVGPVLGLMAVTTVSLYVSTLCSSGLWAVLLSVPASFAVLTFVLKLRAIMEGVLYSLPGRADATIVGWALALMTMAVMALVLRLALENHRSADRRGSRVAGQVAIAAGSMVAATAIVVIVGALSR